MKIGEPTGEVTECDGWNFERNAECSNTVAVRHDPYRTAVIALCRECNSSGEVYGPLDEPYEPEEEYEHQFTAECCGDCKQRIADEDEDEERWVEEQRCIDERLAQERPPTLWSRLRCWVVYAFKRLRVHKERLYCRQCGNKCKIDDSCEECGRCNICCSPA